VNSYVALIRGINVGGRNSLSMKELGEVLEGLGCESVKTYIQSGNVVFRSASPADRLSEQIAAGIARRRGFEPHVLVLERSDFEQAVDNNPFPVGESDPRALHLGFLDSAPRSPDLQGLEARRAPGETFRLIGRVFYLLTPGGVARSRLAATCEKALGVPMTDRNWKTARSIMSMLEAQDP
jgi:uncharacterized protein (DUF1697 family)